ncbi:hypothetical protein ACFLYQ_00570 [Chloroflexota bacterium]
MPDKSTMLYKRVARFVITAIGLGIIGIIFGIAGAFIGGRVLGADSVGFGALGLAIGGVLAGYPAGIIIGIILLKKFFHQRGSLLLGIIGSVIGAALIIVLAGPLNLASNANLLFGTFFLIMPTFCLIGFNLKK